MLPDSVAEDSLADIPDLQILEEGKAFELGASRD